MMGLLSKLKVLLGPEATGRAYMLMFGMTLGAFLEALGVGFIFPFIALIDDPTRLDAFPAAKTFATSVGVVDHGQLVIAMAVLLGLLYLIKNVYLGLLYRAQFKFAFARQVDLAKRLFEFYLRSPYTLHLERNSAELLRNINSESMWIFHHVVIPLMSVFAELCVVVLLCGLLLTVAPMMSLIAFSFLGIVGAGLLLGIRRRSSEAGKEQQANMGEMIRAVNEGLGSVKEAKVYGVESYFLNFYKEKSVNYAEANVFLKTASLAPRLIVETLGIGGILLACIVLVASGADLREYLPHLGLFAVAAVRLMPSMNRIVASMTGVRFFTASVDAVYNDFLRAQDSIIETEVSTWITPQESLEFRDVSFAYDAETPVLRSVSLTIKPGESVGFAGPSGAGKSTLVGLLLGILNATEGDVLVDGQALDTSRETRIRVGYIPQAVRLLDESVRQNIAFGELAERIDDERIQEALETAQLLGFVGEMTDGLDTAIGEDGVRLSGGQRQRLGIARALYTGANVLVFDEATSALDNETEREVAAAIGDLKGERTLIQIAHRLTTLEHCDRIYVMNDGQIEGVGTYQELSQSNATFQQLLASNGS